MKSLLDIEVNRLLPLVFAGNVLNTMYTLESQGILPTINTLFIPAFVSLFGGALLGNLVYKQFNFNPEILIIFAVLLFIFPIIHQISFLKTIFKIFPIIGKSLFFVSLKNSIQPLTNIYSYLLVTESFSKLIGKIVCDTPINLTEGELRKMIINFCIIGSARIFNFHDHYVFAIVFCTSTASLIYYDMTKLRKSLNKHGKSIKSSPKKKDIKQESPSKKDQLGDQV